MDADSGLTIKPADIHGVSLVRIAGDRPTLAKLPSIDQVLPTFNPTSLWPAGSNGAFAYPVSVLPNYYYNPYVGSGFGGFRLPYSAQFGNYGMSNSYGGFGGGFGFGGARFGGARFGGRILG